MQSGCPSRPATALQLASVLSWTPLGGLHGCSCCSNHSRLVRNLSISSDFGSQTSQTNSQNNVPVLSPQPFPLLISSIPMFCISVKGTIVYWITKVKHMSIIHSSSLSCILVSNLAANPVNYASEIPLDCYFYSLFLLPSHFILPSSLNFLRELSLKG